MCLSLSEVSVSFGSVFVSCHSEVNVTCGTGNFQVMTPSLPWILVRIFISHFFLVLSCICRFFSCLVLSFSWPYFLYEICFSFVVLSLSWTFVVLSLSWSCSWPYLLFVFILALSLLSWFVSKKERG